MKGFFFIIITFISIDAYSQKEANNWYFGNKAGITFQDGSPTILTNSSLNSMFGTAVISDSTGNLLFYSDGKVVYNRNHQQMPNGYGLLGLGQSQTCIIFKKPGSYSKYYIFTVGVGSVTQYIGLHYSIIDIELQGGLGDVDNFYKNIPLENSSLAVEKITAVKHADNNSVWVIVRNLSQPVNEYHSYLVTPGGVNNQPVKTSCLSNIPLETSGNNSGQMKVSPDSKYIIAALNTVNGGTEIGQFDNNTGYINNLFNFIEVILGIPFGVEFSSDNRFVYFTNSTPGFVNKIFQYELSLLPDVNLFINSAVNLGRGGNANALQIGPDGKIYVARVVDYYLGVINNPSLKGLDCDYDSLGVYLGGPMCYRGLPQFIQTYFLRFEFEGKCSGENYTFTPNFNPVPDSIHWDFGDPASGTNNYSNDSDPQHIYNQGGIYTVTAFVRYPDGRTETATREVVVASKPAPYPFADTIFCKGASVELQAVEGYESYLWSNGNLTSGITVSDTGSYWVEAVNAEGCTGRDTVRVSWFPLPFPDQTNLIISPTTCGGSTGAIRGLSVTGSNPISLEWKDNTGTVISNDADIFSLPVGNYYLWATDGNGCTSLLGQYTITDAGDVLIDHVDHTASYCAQNNGSITVTAISGLSDMLEYSIDNGINWLNNEGMFIDLPPVSYNVRVRVPDGSGCQAVFTGNPVQIEDFAGPQVSFTTNPATGTNPDGTITLTATGSGNLIYSLNGGAPQNNGNFAGLITGPYSYRVEDENGCFTEGTVEVGQVPGFILSAIAGNDAVCLGVAPVAPLLIENFTGVQAFTATLEYNATLVNCEGFRPGSVHPQLEANLIAEVFPATQRIVVTWSGSAPLTLPGTVTVLDLVFSATQSGNSFLTWDQAPAATWFTGEYGSIEPEFQIGQLQVNNPPKLTQQFPVNVCEGGLAWLTAPVSGNEPFTYQWTLPDGSSSQNSSLMFFEASTANSGQYQVKVSDALGCSDSTLLTLEVTPNPRDWFMQDTIAFENEHLLSGPPGYASYLWNTGDTLPEITVNTEGLYTLLLTTSNLCAGADSTFLKMLEAESPFLVPNAFTPNGDGRNDVFRPVVDYDRLRQFSMVIYNRWGQMIFETNNPAEGWDGKDAMAGVYSWVISYADYLGKVFKMRGSVTVFK